MSAAKRSFFTDQISLTQRPGAVKPQTIFRRRRRKKVQPLKKASRRGPGGSPKTFLACSGLPTGEALPRPHAGQKRGAGRAYYPLFWTRLAAHARVKAGAKA